MPKIDVMNYEINYEVHGNENGEPLIFLNGIMMSTLSWAPFIEAFSDYKAIFIDFFDQGASSKAEKPYTQDLHVEVLKELIEKLNLGKVHLFGISFGGEVAMKFALKYQDMIESLILSNTVSETNPLMHDIEEMWDYAASTYNGSVFFYATMPFIYSAKFYKENIEWLKERAELFKDAFTPEWYDGFRRAIRSAHNLNITDEIHKITVPTLIMGGDLDILTPLENQETIHRKIKNSKMVIMKDAGHGSMYEKPYEFATSVLGFLKTYNKPITIK
ncbi:MAG: alpha/beta hydrolase [Clostridium sp.]|nr:alpha/beta hydrolase [Clostridium sp.]